MKTLVLVLALSALAASPPAAQAADVTEPRTKVSFPERQDGMTLLGTGVRTKTFLKVKVYAIALYVSDTALSGRLAKFRGRTTDPEFYRELVTGDFPKQVVMTFVRDATADQVRDAFHESLPGVDRARLDVFSAHFGAPHEGDSYVVRWVPGGALEVTAAGQAKPPIADKAFSTAVFGIWLGDKPIQEDIKRDLVARAAAVLGAVLGVRSGV
jgi:hypothetical protein